MPSQLFISCVREGAIFVLQPVCCSQYLSAGYDVQHCVTALLPCAPPHTAGMPLVFSPLDHIGAESIQPRLLEAQANQAAAQSSLGLPACARVLQVWWDPATEGELWRCIHSCLHQQQPEQHTEIISHSPSLP